jgi:hypothetical protein
MLHPSRHAREGRNDDGKDEKNSNAFALSATGQNPKKDSWLRLLCSKFLRKFFKTAS